MVVYYKGQKVMLVKEDQHTRTIHLGDGSEITVPRDHVTDHPESPDVVHMQVQPNLPGTEVKGGGMQIQPELGKSGTGVSSDGKPFPNK